MLILDGIKSTCRLHAHLLWYKPCHYLFNTLYSGLCLEASCGNICVRPNSSYLQLRYIPVSVALSDWQNLYSSSPVNGRVFPHSITSRIKFLGTQRYTWMGRSTLRVKYLTWEHNSLTPACLKPLTLDPKSGTLTIGHHTSTSLVIAAFDEIVVEKINVLLWSLPKSGTEMVPSPSVL